jgi:hypothetical protein
MGILDPRNIDHFLRVCERLVDNKMVGQRNHGDLAGISFRIKPLIVVSLVYMGVGH